MKANTFTLFIGVLFLLVLGSSVYARPVHVHNAPPANKVVVVTTPRPHANAVWVKGHWCWKNNAYLWNDGKWIDPKPGCVWVDGHWKNTRHGWEWIEGHWRKVK
ncbi:MAG TPA: hypothetical protein PLP19_00040 [bacterium]|nr:hypothetical protein [bacterium]HPN41857.1 hypothetical protein [bacterium]